MVRNQVVSVGLFWTLFSIFRMLGRTAERIQYSLAGAAGEEAGGSESSGGETPSPEREETSPRAKNPLEKGRCARGEL